MKCDGIEYKRISAYTYRVIKTAKGYKAVFECELLDKCEHSVSIVAADKVELVNVYKKS